MTLLFRGKDEEVVHLVALHKIVALEQSITGLDRLPDHDLAPHSVIFAVSIAVDDSKFGSRPKRSPQILQQRHWLRAGDQILQGLLWPAGSSPIRRDSAGETAPIVPDHG